MSLFRKEYQRGREDKRVSDFGIGKPDGSLDLFFLTLLPFCDKIYILSGFNAYLYIHWNSEEEKRIKGAENAQ